MQNQYELSIFRFLLNLPFKSFFGDDRLSQEHVGHIVGFKTDFVFDHMHIKVGH